MPDPRRVITKLFVPREEIYADGSTRMDAALRRIVAMPEADVRAVLGETRTLFAGRHRDLEAVFERGHQAVVANLARLGPPAGSLTADRQRLIGAYFTQEYSFEAAAVANPSIVAAPDQSGLAAGEVRFVMSLRSIGEGHISSIQFRSGVIDAQATVRLDPPGHHAVTGERSPRVLDKASFTSRLHDLAVINEVEAHVLSRLADDFTIADLDAAIVAFGGEGIEPSMSGETTRLLHWLASSNYAVAFPPTADISERILFPSGPAESAGMEDARFVRFTDDDGSVRYLATYTAFDGQQILPQLIETTDFVDFTVTTLSGHVARNKGIALFPRRVDGQYLALGRHDNVNNFVMASSDVRVWNDATVIQQPQRAWELMQLGNCGSPLETAAGWIVITHGVGPLRRYSLGAILLDLDDPTRVIGHLSEPLLSPDDEREGYVPNVVYSCGSMIHGGHLVLPYAFADMGTGVATLPVDDLLANLTYR